MTNLRMTKSTLPFTPDGITNRSWPSQCHQVGHSLLPFLRYDAQLDSLHQTRSAWLFPQNSGLLPLSARLSHNSTLRNHRKMSDYKVYYGIRNLAKVNTCTSIAFDCETLQLKPELGKLRLLQLGSRARRIVVVIDLFELDDDGLKQIDLFFQNGQRFWLAHNAGFDLGWCAVYGWYPKGEVRDSMLASRLLTNGQHNMKHGLQHVAKRYLDIELDKEEQRSDWSGDLTDSQLKYAAKDVEVLC